MEGLDVWIQKLERANNALYIPPTIYIEILKFVEDAMRLDFNMIIEEFDFY